MTDFNKIAENADKLGLHISPEGVEERICRTDTFLITETQGGKFRIYYNGTPMQMAETFDKAVRMMNSGMAITGHMGNNPVETLEILLGRKNK